jgi:CsoR family transcriptional regulator, copper-sensing transcriptional repressor
MNEQKKKAVIALKKSRTSIDSIIKMIEGDEYCIDVMQQNLAVMGLLKSAHQTLLENHLNTCFTSAMNAKNPKIKQEMIDEIIKISKIASKFSCNWSLKSCSKD